MLLGSLLSLGVTADTAVTPTVIVVIVTVIVVAEWLQWYCSSAKYFLYMIALVLNIYKLCMIVIFISCCPTLKFKL